jgi:uncharacterized protein
MSKVLSANLEQEEILVEEESNVGPVSPKKKRAIYISILIIILICLLFILERFGKNPFGGLPSFVESLIHEEFLTFILVGFIAQMIDGALGMAYGVSSTSMMINAGISPAIASAGVHTAEVFTTGASGLSHLFAGNVNKKLFKRLIIPGVIGAIVGAFVSSYIDKAGADIIKPFVAVYLLIMGALIIKKAFRKVKKKQKTKRLVPLALFGGFVDSIGGGGWGPVVTSTLIGKGRNPKYTIGSVNLAEFFVALGSASMFMIMLGLQNWRIVLGLIVGGVIASPLAAFLVGRIKVKPMMILVGALIMIVNIPIVLKFPEVIMKLVKMLG